MLTHLCKLTAVLALLLLLFLLCRSGIKNFPVHCHSPRSVAQQDSTQPSSTLSAAQSLCEKETRIDLAEAALLASLFGEGKVKSETVAVRTQIHIRTNRQTSRPTDGKEWFIHYLHANYNGAGRDPGDLGIGSDCNNATCLGDSCIGAIMDGLNGKSNRSDSICQCTGQMHVPTQKSHLLLVHGYGCSAALAWRNVIGPISKHYEVFAVDLPGFGRSSIPESVLDGTANEILDQYCDALQAFHTSANIHRPYVVAHSFGGFMYTHCISRNETMARKLLLSDVPGIFPTNSEYDFVWGTFFNLGLPHTAVRPFGDYFHHIAKQIIDWANIEVDEKIVDYWQELQRSPLLKSDRIVSKFVQHKYTYILGSELALIPLLNIKIPYGFLSGAEDIISPPHHGHFLTELSGVKHYEIQGAGHVPYNHNRGKDFVEVTLSS